MNQLNDEHYRALCAQLASLERAYQDLSRKIEALREKPKWRELVDVWAGVVSTNSTLADVLGSLSGVARSGPSGRATGDRLAQIVAICEKRADDGWQADPDRVPVGHWGISWLLVPLSHEPPDWAVVGDRAAAWLRSLTDGGVA